MARIDAGMDCPAPFEPAFGAAAAAPRVASGLGRLYQRTQTLLQEDRTITRALNWVDEVLPVFTSACRSTLVQAEPPEMIERWQAWVEGPGFRVVEEAGKGLLYEWRRDWLRRLLAATSLLSGRLIGVQESDRAEWAHRLWAENSNHLPCFPEAFWHDLVSYLSASPEDGAGPVRMDFPGAAPLRFGVPFPLILSESVVDGGSETTVLMAEFVFEPGRRRTGEVYLDPGQAALRCMDETFARTFAQAVEVARGTSGRASAALPDVRVRVRTLKPGHERFLSGTVLRGPSGAGALALGIACQYAGRAPSRERFAVSFALASGHTPDGRCHPVGGSDDKVRGCAKEGVEHLLLAWEQVNPVAAYAHRHGIEAIGASSFGEALQWVRSLADGAIQASKARDIVLLYVRAADQDAYLCRILESRLAERGHRVFVDRHLTVGVAWAAEIDRRIREADAVIPLLSSASLHSQMLTDEVQAAHEAGQRQGGRPRLLPVRVGDAGILPEGISHILDPLQHALWEGPDDDERLLAEMERGLQAEKGLASPGAREPVPSPPADALEPFDGVVPVGSRFYIARQVDQELYTAVDERHSVLLLKGPRQVGKSSLLARGLDRARSSGLTVAVTDFQKLSVQDLASPRAFYLALGRMLARQLKVKTAIEETWTEGRSPNLNFEEYMEDYVLPEASPLLWAIDEADRLFLACDFSSDVFGLFRSWANERQGKSTSPWSRVSMAIVYATEAHLFIKDMNQSPFNIGTRFELEDFTVHEVAELNERYGSPLADDVELARFYCLVGGHPYLTRRGLYAMVRQGAAIDAFEATADRDDGPLGDHLRRMLTLLTRNEDNLRAIQAVLAGRPCPTSGAFYHLRSAGILAGAYPPESRLRSLLYAKYLKRHLLAE